MYNKLVLHPSAPATPANKLSISAQAQVKGFILNLNYLIECSLGSPNVVWPLSSLPDLKHERKDELWKTTCLEAFLLFEGGNYLELNFSPDGNWNAYSFDSYRQGMRSEEQIQEISEFTSSHEGSIYQLSVAVDLSRAVKSTQNFRLGLACVIETEGGERSYWSLKHPGDKPDFHDSRGQILDMRILRVTT